MNQQSLRRLNLVFLICIPALLWSSDLPLDVEQALEKAGENRAELEKVLSHYDQPEDSLKLQAARFLIGNMEGHSYVTFALRDSNDAEIDLNVLDFENFKALTDHCDALEEEFGVIDFGKDETISDLDTITAEFLIEQIDYAFKAWEEKPWAKDLTFDQFCNYVLPYRGSNEPLEPWRKYFWKKYKDISKQVDDPSDPVQIAAAINNDIMSWFHFDERYYLHPTDQGFQEMLDVKLGRCEDMTNLTIFAMRANGLAVVSDYTPYWANIGNNHAWNAIIKPDGEVIPFMGAEANPGKYHLSYKLGKAYRKMYAKQPRNLTFQERKQEDLPRWLAGKSYTDVTADYTDVSDVVVAFTKEIPDTVDLAYLCVFNTGEWKPIEWGWVKSNKSLFTDMGVDVVYLPGLYLDKEIVPYSPPIILTKDKQIRILLPETDKTQTIALTSTTKRIQDLSTEGMQVTHLKDGAEYTLSYWQDGWMEIGKQTAGDEPLTFENVPAGGLYWLVPDDGGEEERIFTVEDGVQVWW